MKAWMAQKKAERKRVEKSTHEQNDQWAKERMEKNEKWNSERKGEGEVSHEDYKGKCLRGCMYF